MGHYREECKHGIIRGQCRCPGPKTVKIVPCGGTCAADVVETVNSDAEFIDDLLLFVNGSIERLVEMRIGTTNFTVKNELAAAENAYEIVKLKIMEYKDDAANQGILG